MQHLGPPQSLSHTTNHRATAESLSPAGSFLLE